MKAKNLAQVQHLYNVFIFIEGKYPSMFGNWIIKVQKGKELVRMMHYVWCLDVVRRNEDLSMFENCSCASTKLRKAKENAKYIHMYYVFRR